MYKKHLLIKINVVRIICTDVIVCDAYVELSYSV